MKKILFKILIKLNKLALVAAFLTANSTSRYLHFQEPVNRQIIDNANELFRKNNKTNNL